MAVRWDLEGDLAVTEHWRSMVPGLSGDLAGDLTDVANDRPRVERVRRRYGLELKHIGGSKHAGRTSLTRISDWLILTDEHRRQPRPGVPFALCRGRPAVRIEPAPGRVSTGLDHAIQVQVAPALLPFGPLLLDGVPLVIHALAPYRPLPGNADALWPPVYPVAARRH